MACRRLRDPHCSERTQACAARPGTQAEGPAILADAASRIGERAAIPKEVIIVDALPLTPIGKIHKLTLRLREMERTAREALVLAGIPFDRVDAVADDRRGSLVRVAARPDLVEQIRDALRPFAFQHEVLADQRAQ